MVLTLMVITARHVDLERYITMQAPRGMAKVILLTGTLVGYAYATEFFIAWYSGNPTSGTLHEPRHRTLRLVPTGRW